MKINESSLFYVCVKDLQVTEGNKNILEISRPNNLRPTATCCLYLSIYIYIYYYNMSLNSFTQQLLC